MEVIGRSMGLYRFGKVKEGSRGVIEWVDVYDNVKAAGSVWVNSG